VDQRDLDSADYAGRNNPYAVINRMQNTNNTNHIFGKIVGQYVFTPNLNLRVGIAADYYRLNEKRFRPSAGFLPEGYIIRASSEKNSSELMALNENVLSYNKTSASGVHVFSAFVGTALQSNEQNSKTAVAVNSTSDQFTNISTSDQRFIDSIGSFSPNWRLLSFFSGAQYAFQNKYLVSANLRADGSSRFAKGKRWGYFPSVAAGWRIGQEPILKNSRIISELKLRTSYGLSGNQEVGFFNSLNALIPADYSDYAGVRIGILGNPDFTWERTKQFDAGLDIGFLKDRLFLTADVYIKNTTNLYNTIQLPGSSGFRTYSVSEGSVRNTGLELSVSGKVLAAGKFGWQTSLNASFNRNKITYVPNLFNPVNNYGDVTGILQVGNSIGAFYGYKALGVYKSSTDVKLKNGSDNANPFRGGDIIFEDVDNNGTIDQADRQIIGNTNPDIFGGFNNTFSYRSFDLNVFVDFSLGNEVYNAQRALLESMSTYDNQSTTVLQRWRTEGDETTLPRALHGDAVGNTRFSSRWIEDGSFARVKALTLGYNFPLTSTLKGVFKSARVILTAQNLITFTKYKGFGPEIGSVSNPILYGLDYANLPQLKSFMLGIKLGL
ncbi:MAG: SusC/RagA family TonB-linked outer membrane protein, partial [Sphingobacteriaceae bacterium]